MADQIVLRRDTEANWIEADPVLAQGEHAITLDDLATEPKFKIGDGIHLWSELPYFSGTGGTLPIGTVGQTLRYNYDNELEANDKLLINDFEISLTVPDNVNINTDNFIVTTKKIELKLQDENGDIDNTNKYLRIKNADGEIEFVDIALLPSGTANQILRHNGTDWVVANYTTLTDTATSSKLAIVNGANPTGKNAYIEVDDTYSRLWLQNDNTAPFGGANYVNIYSTQDKAWIALSGFGGQDLIMLLRNDAEGYLKIGNQNGENVFVGAKDYPSTTNENIYIEDGSLVKTFIVTNNGKLFTKQHPQIDTTEAAAGKVLVCTDADGNSQWQKKSDLILQTSDLNLTINPTNNIYYVLGWDALANKNYKFEYGLNIRWYNDNELANLFTFQIKIGEDVPTEICYAYGSILVNGQAASLLDQDNLNAYIDMTTTDAKWNILDNAGYIFKIEGVLKMGSTNKTVTMKIITTGTEDVITIQPYLQTHSYLKWEEF